MVKRSLLKKSHIRFYRTLEHIEGDDWGSVLWLFRIQTVVLKNFLRNFVRFLATENSNARISIIRAKVFTFFSSFGLTDWVRLP